LSLDQRQGACCIGHVGILAGQAAAQETELRFSTYLTADNRIVEIMINPMRAGYAKLTGASSRIELYPDGQLIKGAAPQLEGIRAGTADFTYTLAAFTPELMPRTLMFELHGRELQSRRFGCHRVLAKERHSDP
jgi:TRAP-type C4-dicarboxylate transport system substrate-binding protein